MLQYNKTLIKSTARWPPVTVPYVRLTKFQELSEPLIGTNSAQSVQQTWRNWRRLRTESAHEVGEQIRRKHFFVCLLEHKAMLSVEY